MKLNLGAGHDIKPGFINVDLTQGIGIDKVVDLNKYPLPWDNNSIEEIYASHIIEHLDNPYNFMLEVYRILKPGGIFTAKMPIYNWGICHKRGIHSKGYFFALTNKNRLENYQALNYFDVIYEKRNFRFRIWFFQTYRKIIDFFFSEFEYKLKKVKK